MRLTGTWQGLEFSVIIPDNVAPGQRFVAVIPQNQEDEDQDASLNPHFEAKGRPPLGLTPIPETRSSLCNRMCFLWIIPLLCVSGKKTLEKSDLWTTPDYNRAARVTAEVQHLYSESKVLILASTQLCTFTICYDLIISYATSVHSFSGRGVGTAYCMLLRAPAFLSQFSWPLEK